MCIIYINKSGRFGNNIQQLIIAYHFAFIENNCKEIIFNNVNFLKTNKICNHNSNHCKCDKQLYYKCKQSGVTNMFYYPKGCHKPDVTLYDYKNIIQKYIKPYIKDELYIKNVYNKNVIHIRSGDVSQITDINCNYCMRPNKYYDNIISILESCTIVYESNNQNILYLKQKYSNNQNIKFQSSGMVNDFNTLVNCETLVMSVGTYSVAAYLLSNSIKTIYCYKVQSLKLPNFGNDPNLEIIDLYEKSDH